MVGFKTFESHRIESKSNPAARSGGFQWCRRNHQPLPWAAIQYDGIAARLEGLCGVLPRWRPGRRRSEGGS
eukprot:132987-Prorocentrum_minimum.AAC.1